MNWYIFLYVAITLAIIISGIGIIIWLKKKIAPWDGESGGFIIVERFMIDFKWHIVVMKYRDKYYMLALSDRDLRLIDTWPDKSEERSEKAFREVLEE